MDCFREEAVSKHNRILEEITYYLSIVMMVIFGLFALIQISGCISYISSTGFDLNLIVSLVIGLVPGAFAVLIYLYRGRLRTEYEYSFTNGDLTFSAIYNNAKRKSLGSLNVKTVEAFGPVNSGAFNRYLNMQGVKQTRWFLNREAELYFFFWQKDGSKRIITFEPSKEMVEDIQKYLPRGVYQEH